MALRESLRRWFFARQKAESGSIELNQPRIYILPSKTGALFAMAILVMYVGAVNYNLGLGHALVFLLTGLSLTGMLHTFRNLLGLRVRAGKTTPVFAGDAARFEILVENLRDEPRPGVLLQKFDANATSDGDRTQRADLAPLSITPITLSERATSRGMLPLGRLIVSTRYPLGLFRAWSYPWPISQCLIYPTPIFVPLPAPRGSDRTIGNQAVQTDSQDDFAGFRRHQPGDSPRHVAWKIYARDAAESPLLVKEFAGSGMVQYWLDWNLTSPAEDTETRLSILCGWVLQAQRDNLPFGMDLPGFRLLPGQGETHVAQALEALALFGTAR